MNRLQTPLVRLAGLALCLAALPCLPASAHDVSPAFAELRPGTSSLIYVEDFTGCKADIFVQSTDPSVVKVWALDPLTGFVIPGDGVNAFVPDAKVAYFMIIGSSGVTSEVTAPVTVCWVGENWPNGPCDENNCFPVGFPHIVPVTVKPPPFTRGALASGGITGDPILTASGELYIGRREVLSLGGPLPVEFGMQYGSAMEASGIPLGNMGPGWRNDTDWVLRIVGDGAYEVTLPDGRVARFRRGPPDWDYVQETYLDVPFQLSRPNPGTEYKLLDPRTGLVYSFANVGSIGVSSRAIRVEDGKGNVQTRVATFSGPVTKIQDGLGRQITLAYVGGKLSTVTDGTRTATFTYDAQGQLATYTNVAGHTTSYSYDPAFPNKGQLVAEQRPQGNVPFTQVFDAEQRVIQQADAAGAVTSLAYVASLVSGTAIKTTITDPLGNQTEHHHDAGQLTEEKDAAASSILLGHNASGQSTQLIDRKGATTNASVHAPSGEIETLTDPEGATTAYARVLRAQLGFDVWDVEFETLADGSVEGYGYDSQGNLTVITDADGFNWSFTYNARGQVLTETDPSGATWTSTYNPDGTLASSTDPLGHTTSYTYDAFKRRVATVYPDGTTRAWTWSLTGALTSVTNEEGETTQLVHDDNDRVTQWILPSGAGETYSYDEQGRIEEAVNGMLQPTQLEYDQRGDLKKFTLPSGRATNLGYGATGFQTELTDAAGASWMTGRDAEGLASSQSDPLGRTHQTVYDQLGRPKGFTEPGGAQTTLGLNSLGQVISLLNAAGHTTNATRNARGAITAISGALGAASAVAYDSRGNIDKISDPGGNDWTYTYGPRGDVTESKDPQGRATAFEYDKRKNLIKKTLPAGLGSVVIAWTDDGRLSAVNGSDGSSSVFTYDTDNRFTGGTNLSIGYDASGRINSSNGVVTERDVDGRPSKVTLAPGVEVTYTYDAAGRWDSAADNQGNSVQVTRNAAGQVLTLQRSSGPSSTYTYGPNTRCSKEQHGNVYDAEYAYTSLGDVSNVKLFATPQVSSPSAGTQAYSYNSSGERSGAVHDGAGRILSDGLRSMGWSVAGDMTSISDGVETVQYVYDCVKRPFSRELAGSGVVRSFVRNDACGGAAVVVRENGVDVTYRITTPDGTPLWTIDVAGGNVTWLILNVAGHLVATTDSSGVVQCAHEYMPNGAPLGPPATCDCEFTFRAAQGHLSERIGSVILAPGGPRDDSVGRLLAPTAVGIGPQSSNAYAVSAAAAPGIPTQYRYGSSRVGPDTRGSGAGPGVRRGEHPSSSSTQASYRYAPRDRIGTTSTSRDDQYAYASRERSRPGLGGQYAYDTRVTTRHGRGGRFSDAGAEHPDTLLDRLLHGGQAVIRESAWRRRQAARRMQSGSPGETSASMYRYDFGPEIPADEYEFGRAWAEGMRERIEQATGTGASRGERRGMTEHKLFNPLLESTRPFTLLEHKLTLRRVPH